LYHQPIISALGDSGILLEISGSIEEITNRRIVAFRNWLSLNPFEGMREIIIAYTSVAVFYDPSTIKKKNEPATGSVYETVRSKLLSAFKEAGNGAAVESVLHHIPVCYDPEFGVDLGFLSQNNNLSFDQIVHLHTYRPFRVYMLGFVPGFPYMGVVDAELECQRKPSPVAVAAGSVGIAGIQTGIYPLNSPGGWQIIGRTPVKLFERDKNPPVVINPGDDVRFYGISKDEFYQKEWTLTSERREGP
jgi:inhibitor of KinA